MLQLPVGNLEKIRKSRKRVKDVLCDVGLGNCKDLLNELQSFDVGDEAFDNTDWFDFTEGYHGKRRKKWHYRTRGLCCTLCRFSARSWNSYRTHMLRYHEEEQDIGALAVCSCCSFVAHPKVVIEHFKTFHPDSMKSPSAPIPSAGAANTKGVPVMVETTVTGDSKFGKKYLQQKLPSLAPKVIQQNVYNVPLVHGANTSQLGGTVARPPFSGTVLRGTPSNTTTVVCSPATGQAFLPGQTSTVVRLANVEAQSLIRTGQAVTTLKNAQLPKGISAGGVATTLVRAPVGTLLPTVSQNGPKPLPITLGVPTQTQQPRQVLLPPGVQVNVQGKLALRGPGPQPLLVTQRLPVTQSTSRGTVLTTQSLFSHLIPTGNKVNGLPTYTLAPVQVTVPVQSNSAQLLEHTAKEHSTSRLANRNFMKQEYHLHINDHGDLLVPHFDINTTAPKELLGDKELNLALVTVSLDLIYVKLLPGSAQPVCRAPIKTVRADCPFCPEKPQTVEDYELHLKIKHHIVPTIHAILKSPAFKCAYCSGVYTGKTTPQAISTHVQRCRCAPKTAKDVERLINPDPKRQVVAVNGGVSHPAASKIGLPASEAEAQIQSRLEAAMKAALEANKQERDARAAKRSQLRYSQESTVQIEGTPITSDTTGKEMLPFDERNKFLTDYFHKNPYPNNTEMETLSARLWFTKTDLAGHFDARRSKCMQAIQKHKTVVLLGFNMTELKKVKHNVQIPVKEPETSAETLCV
ncbi:hypothetical protein COCON_G00008210 [Conger conger]|uniref:Uncharacterized protein n=1 Tax=Conger conger TaxID=82655 RepID=A0A9Q1I704_CONCO|nr:hypothetical protein COCON_G00008210 [Conger conger]